MNLAWERSGSVPWLILKPGWAKHGLWARSSLTGNIIWPLGGCPPINNIWSGLWLPCCVPHGAKPCPLLLGQHAALPPSLAGWAKPWPACTASGLGCCCYCCNHLGNCSASPAPSGSSSCPYCSTLGSRHGSGSG